MALKPTVDTELSGSEAVCPTVLVVDDDAGLNRLVCKALGRDGLTTESVYSGQEAVAAASRASASLMLLDYNLPDMTGQEVAAALAERNIDLPFIIMTGAGDEKIAVTMMKMGAWDYIVKDGDFLPHLPRLIRQTVSNVVARRKLAESQQQIKASNQQLLALNDELVAHQEKLRESEARYRAVVDGSADGILIAEVETKRFIFANRALCEMLGYSPVELNSLGIRDLHPKESLPRIFAEFEAQARGEVSLAAEIPCLRKDGSIVYADINTALVVLEGRKCNVGFFRDVSGRRMAEAAIRDSEERLKQLFEYAPDAYYINDLTGTFIDGNRSAEELTGYKREELIGRNMVEIGLLKAAQIPRAAANLAKNALGEATGPDEFTLTRKDGAVVQVEIRTYPIKIKQQAFVLGIARDITERRVREQQIRDLARFPSENPDAVMRTEREGTVTYANDAAKRLFGKTLSLASHTHGRVLASAVETALSTASQHSVELELDGRTLMFAVVPIHERGYANLYGRDITESRRAEGERRKLEDQFRQMQKMEAIGQLAGGVAHDFNNSLGGIMGYADLLRLHLRDNPKLRGYVEKIVGSVNRASALTHQLLSFARRGRLEMGAVDIHNVIKETSDILRQTFDRRIRIDHELRAQPSLVYGDVNQLAHAFLNLAINARDAMPEGGTLTFLTRREQLRADSFASEGFNAVPGSYVCVSVRDTGVGMSAETRARIFEPFFTTKETGKGTGLGLASVYGTVKQHGGYIMARSEPGMGARFDVFLPEWAGQAAADPVEKDDVVAGTGQVMVIDDEENIRETTADCLDELGYRPVCFGDPVEALTYYRSHHRDIAAVVLDLIMPKMNGLQCFRALKQVDPLVRVLVVSGYSEGDQSRAILDEGARAFVEKPFTVERLSTALAGVMAAGGPDEAGRDAQ